MFNTRNTKKIGKRAIVRNKTIFQEKKSHGAMNLDLLFFLNCFGGSVYFFLIAI
jgi:hypothetical protein